MGAKIVERSGVGDSLVRMRDFALALYEELGAGGRPDALGRYLHENRLLKRELDSGVSTAEVDTWYERALAAGALGGKLLGVEEEASSSSTPPSDPAARPCGVLGTSRDAVPAGADGSRIIHVSR